MRVIIVHRTNADWETGNVKPDPKVIGRVGKMIHDMQKAGELDGGDGLGPSSRGVRLHCSGGDCRVTKGPLPLTGANDLVGFASVSVPTIDDAVAMARKLAGGADVEIDIRPLVEPWDLGVAEKPADLKTTRYMILHKGPVKGEQSLDDAKRTGALLVREQAKAGAKATRVRRAKTGVELRDGPFTEAKEMVGGYAIVKVADRERAIEWAKQYVECVDVSEVDLVELS